jgi:hypothetical protein
MGGLRASARRIVAGTVTVAATLLAVVPIAGAIPRQATTTVPGVRALDIDESTVPPGGEVTATGQGCDPGASVTLEIAGEEVGRATADNAGTFETEIDVPNVEPGRVEVLARCGPVLTTDLDIVLASEVSSGTSNFLVLMFFLIVLVALLWYGRQTRGSGGR